MTKRWRRKPHVDPSVRQHVTAMMAPHGHRQKALTDGLDALAAEMERKWGVDRLPLLVDDNLRARFYQQQDLLNEALQSGDLQLIDLQVGGMKRAWEALDKAAAEAAAEPLAVDVWEIKLPDSGKIVAFVRTTAEARLVASPDREVWTASEIAHLIDGMDDTVAEIKRVFPGAEVTAIRKKEQSSAGRKNPIDWEKGDEIPF